VEERTAGRGTVVNESNDFAENTFTGLDELGFVNRLRQGGDSRFVGTLAPALVGMCNSP